MAFLAACTEPTQPLKCFFDAHEVPELGRVGRLEDELHRRFGKGAPHSQRSRITVDPLQIADALRFLDDIDPQPTNRWEMAPIWFWVGSEFRIIDPDTGVPLAGQVPERFGGVEYQWRVPLGTSGLRLILHNRAQVALELCIPDADEGVTGRVVPWLQEHLPFGLSPKQWRLWTRTRTGSFRARRTSMPVGARGSRS